MTQHHRNEPLVTIATFRSSVEASLARGALEAIGIEAFVPDEALGTFTRNRGATGAGALQVFESDCDAAVAELKRLEREGGRGER